MEWVKFGAAIAVGISFFLPSLSWAEQADNASPIIQPPGLPTPPTIPESIRTNPPTPPANLPDSAALMEQLRMMEHLLQLTPEQLVRLRQALEIIERMSENDRIVMRQRLQHMRTVSQKSDSQLRWVAQQVPTQHRRSAAQFWLSLTDDARSELWNEWQSLPEAERQAAIMRTLADFVAKREEQTKALQRR